MTQAEKLETLVRRAVENDFKPRFFSWVPEDEKALVSYWLKRDQYMSVIFNHDFARALFGKDMLNSKGEVVPNAPGTWYPALMEAVISDNPIDYMYEAVFGGKDGI